MTSISQVSSWKDFFLKSKNLDYTNSLLKKLQGSIEQNKNFSNSFNEISKNQGITFLSLDPSEKRLQLFHHPTVFGGNWSDPDEKLLAIYGVEDDAKPIEIISKSIKDIKGKSHSAHEFSLGMNNKDDFNLLRNPKQDYNYKNIIPLPVLLTKVFIDLPSTDPVSVALAFLAAMHKYDLETDQINSNDNASPDCESITSEPDLLDPIDDPKTKIPVTKSTRNQKTNKSNNEAFLIHFIHVIQFCHLCSKGKVTPVLFTFDPSPSVSNWFNSIKMASGISRPTKLKRPSDRHTNIELSDDDDIESPENKISRKDKQFFQTLLKINDKIDNDLLKSNQDREDKEPGFNRLEPHRKNLILNASAPPPYDQAADSPTEFYTTFLSKKSQFKAKEMLVHRLSIDKVSFNPNTTFVSYLWNSDFFWILPDSPSGISIFFCPESKSLNSYELEKERNLALADKVKHTDLEKLTKQKLTIPTTIMDMVWMTQNMHAILKLCFGPASHSAKFLKSWANHMYDNRIMYTSLQTTDNSFFAKVLFSIDSALQTHWRSCCDSTERVSVNDRVLFAQDHQDLILRHSFIQLIPKSIQDKIPDLLDTNKLGGGGGGRFKGNEDKNKYKDKKNEDKEVITDDNKAHQKWRVRDGESFSKVFYFNQKKCPKNKDGKLLCMKFFITGICNSSCQRIHKLTPDDEKAFDKFVISCREANEGKDKPDF